MSDIRDPLPGHNRVAVLGLGESGRAACRILAHAGKQVIASDLNPTITDLPQLPGVRYELGAHQLGDATAAVLSPSLNPEWPENQEKESLAEVRKRKARGKLHLVSEIELGDTAYRGDVLAVGGTDGKSTTAALTYHILSSVGHDVSLGGNSWTAFTDVVLKRPDAPFAVVEVSAFQLWDPHGFSPLAIAFTNVAVDHVDHYGSYKSYVRAKSHSLRNLLPGRAMIYWAEDPTLNAWARGVVSRNARTVAYGHAKGRFRIREDRCTDLRRELEFPVGNLSLPGLHNQRNAVAAVLLAFEADKGERLNSASIEEALRSFRGLPHRMQLVREVGGSRWFNDSKATNVNAACTGISSHDRPFIAIVGGVDKGLDLNPLIDVLAERALATIVIGELQDRLMREGGSRIPRLQAAATLEQAVHRAKSLASDGVDVLLSPACSSFDMFSSFEARGDAFADLVTSLPG